MSLVAGVITVLGDGSYSASPSLGPFNIPSTATSYAQADFEKEMVALLATQTSSTLAIVVDATTTPPTTVKGKMLQAVALQVNARASATIGYLTANAVVSVSVPATGINDSTSHACTGTASGTGTVS